MGGHYPDASFKRYLNKIIKELVGKWRDEQETTNDPPVRCVFKPFVALYYKSQQIIK
jgi:hypothetical protein